MKHALISILVLLCGCNSYTPKPNSSGAPIDLKATPLDYLTIQESILKPYCLACHASASGNAGGVNLETYIKVKLFIKGVHETTSVKKTMPPGQPIPEDLQVLLTNWVEKGAPEFAEAPSTPEEAKSPEPEDVKLLEPTFASISKNILTPKCAICHGGDTPISDYDFLIKSKWIVPKDLEKSILYQSVKKGEMPMSEPLKEEETKAIEQWIMNGALKEEIKFQEGELL